MSKPRPTCPPSFPPPRLSREVFGKPVFPKKIRLKHLQGFEKIKLKTAKIFFL